MCGPERALLQGLIQIAAGYYHLGQRNAAGAQYLFTRARARVLPWLPSHATLALDDLIAQVDAALSAIDQGRDEVIHPSLRKRS